MDVIDADPRNGGAESLARLAAEGLIPQPLAVVETPSGGWHVYVPTLGVGKSTPLPGLDLQGAGSFVLAPPTPGYRVVPRADWPDLGQHPADAADRLRAAIRARFPSPEVAAPTADDGTPPTQQELDKARAVLEKAYREVRTGEGGRNNSVSRHLLPLYNFVLAGCLDQAEVEDRLWDAAQDAPGDHPYTRAEFVASCESAMAKAHAERPHVDGPEADFDALPPEPPPEDRGHPRPVPQSVARGVARPQSAAARVRRRPDDPGGCLGCVRGTGRASQVPDRPRASAIPQESAQWVRC